MERMRALSVCQPFAEQIMRGTKKIEYRTRPTNIRERVYIYASKSPRPIEDWKGMDMRPGDLPTGVIVGTVEVVGCTGRPGDYKWHLSNPQRLSRRLKPRKHPQPIWFYPF